LCGLFTNNNLSPPFNLALTLLAAIPFLLLHRKFKILIAVTTTAIAFICLPNTGKEFRLTMLSVGQGESILISHQGRHILVDGGGIFSPRFDTGERLVAPALGYLGIRKLEAVVLTHDDLDHREGLIRVMDSFPVKQFISNIPLSRLHPSLRKVIVDNNIPLLSPPPGWSLFPDRPGFHIFSPTGRKLRDNNRSLCLYLNVENNGILLTGDLEDIGFEQLFSYPVPGKVDLLKLPHHGSKTAKPAPILNKLSPSLAAVSCGFNNRMGLPHHSWRTELERCKIPLLRTDIDGTIQFSLKQGKWHIKRWKNGLFR